MKKVITYGTYDLLHHGHLRLLERAKALGDYLIVGVTSDDFDKQRGKINVQQTLMERIKAVKETGLADEIIVEEYEGQKIDDIIKYGIDVFAIGSDWEGKFDYIRDYCELVYLPRTEGVSSSDIRTSERKLIMGLVGDGASAFFLDKILTESSFVNGVEFKGICTNDIEEMSENIKKLPIVTNDINILLDSVDAVFLKSNVENKYKDMKAALLKHKNVLCESPIALSLGECKELYELAEKNKCIIMEAIRTAYSTAYSRLLLMLKTGKIGDVLAVDVTCTSLEEKDDSKVNSLFEWGSNALLPIFQILGTNYTSKEIITKYIDKNEKRDCFTRINFIYPRSTATLTVGQRGKKEGELVISGSKGYIVVPSPWWKTDYFEVRYENPNDNKRYFYQLEGEGIRNELVSFSKAIQNNLCDNHISLDVTESIAKIMEDYLKDIDVYEIK